MDKQLESQLTKMGIFSLKQARRLGLSQQSVSKLVAAKKLKRIARGMYLHPKANIDHGVGYQIACAKFGPKSAIGGLSALFHYNLAEQVPGQDWVLVPPEKKSKERGYKLIRTKVRLDREILNKNGYRIVSVERAILEGLKFITKVGEHTAIKAARVGFAKKQTNIMKLSKAARELGLQSVIAKYLQVIAP